MAHAKRSVTAVHGWLPLRTWKPTMMTQTTQKTWEANRPLNTLSSFSTLRALTMLNSCVKGGRWEGGVGGSGSAEGAAGSACRNESGVLQHSCWPHAPQHRQQRCPPGRR